MISIINKVLIFFNLLSFELKKKFLISIFFMIVISVLDVLNVTMLAPLGLKILNQSIPKILSDITLFKNLVDDTNLLIIFLIILFSIKLISVNYLVKYNSHLLYEIKSFFQFSQVKQHFSLNYSEHIKKNFSQFLNDCHVNGIVFIDNFVRPLLSIFGELITLVFLILVLLIYDIKFLIIITTLIIFIIFINKNFLQKSIYQIGKERDAADTNLTSIFKDLFNIFRDIKLNNLERLMIDDISQDIKNSNILYGKRNQKAEIVKYIMEFLFIITVLTTILIYTNFYNIKYIENLVIGLVFLIRIVPIKNRILSSYQSMNYSKVVVDRFLNNFNKINNYHYKENLNNSNLNFRLQSIQFSKISFQYADNKYILEDIKFLINKGDKILIQGESGSGKSTLIDILTNLLIPTKGEIIINGKPIDHESKFYFNRIGYISQYNYFIDGTILNNLRLFNKINDEKQISDVLDLTNSKEFINHLPDGINTVLTKDAIELSGGQKQRISLARYLLKDFDFLILDEATNALDKINEKSIITKIFNKYNDRGIIIISHDLDHDVEFDFIYKLSHKKLNLIKKK